MDAERIAALVDGKVRGPMADRQQRPSATTTGARMILRRARLVQYTPDAVRAHLSYYNNGESTLAVPCGVVDAMAVPMDPAHTDYGGAPAIPFSRSAIYALRRAAPIPCAPRHAIAPATADSVSQGKI